MDGLGKITTRILDEARQEAQKIIDEALDKAFGIKEERFKKAESLKQQLEAEASAGAANHKKKLIAAAELEMRKEMLKAKRQILDSAFEESIRAFKNMPFSEYKALVGEMLVSQNFQGSSEVVFSKSDKDRFGRDFEDEINNALKAQGKDPDLKFSDEYGSFEGGFIVKGSGVEVNNTLETLVKLVRDDTEPIAAKILFANGSEREEDL